MEQERHAACLLNGLKAVTSQAKEVSISILVARVHLAMGGIWMAMLRNACYAGL